MEQKPKGPTGTLVFGLRSKIAVVLMFEEGMYRADTALVPGVTTPATWSALRKLTNQTTSPFLLRLDTHLYHGYELPVFYDSLVAKLVGYDLTRDGAIRVLRRALKEFILQPVKTTIPLYLKIVDDPAFQKRDIHTGYVKKFVSPNLVKVGVP